ncbi:hypothetical protein [Sphingobacterium sp. JB170]|uniref:hypothetical protein n=1 Tax=Sphingobacterium sp. JB170 TaxID=1434842 RepID=UPI0015C5CDF6|nr:hypothetical protein [Sphingobacterium sp. JB170]
MISSICFDPVAIEMAINVRLGLPHIVHLPVQTSRKIMPVTYNAQKSISQINIELSTF